MVGSESSEIGWEEKPLTALTKMTTDRVTDRADVEPALGEVLRFLMIAAAMGADVEVEWIPVLLDEVAKGLARGLRVTGHSFADHGPAGGGEVRIVTDERWGDGVGHKD